MKYISLLSFGAVKENGDIGWNNGTMVKKPAGFDNRGRSPAGILWARREPKELGAIIYFPE
jgi:hypothetical protein